MKRYDKLLFVSSSDTCRGPMAEAIMKSKFLLAPLKVESRGLVVLFPEPMNQKAEAVLVSNGLNIKGHTSVALTEKDFSERCLVLTMESQQKNKIISEYNNACNVYSIGEYLKVDGAVKAPVGGALVDYGECFEILDVLIKRLVVVLNEEELL